MRGLLCLHRAVGRAALDRPGRALPAGRREPGQRVRRAGVSAELERRGHEVLRLDTGDRVKRLLSADASSDIVHVHEPFAPSVSSAALRHSYSLNVATFHAPQERVLSTQVARPLVEIFFGRHRRPHGDQRGDRASCWSATSPPATSWSSRAGRSATGPRSPTSWKRSTGACWPAATTRRRPGAARADRRAAADRGRPAHAHRPLGRLRDPGRGAAADGPRPRPRGDRDHRPQRGLRGAGGAPDRRGDGRHQGDRRRGGEDRRAGRGDRPLPRGEDPEGADDGGDDRRDPRPGRARLRAASRSTASTRCPTTSTCSTSSRRSTSSRSSTRGWR